MSAGAIQIRLECVYCRSAVVFPAERVQQESFGVGEMRTAVVALVPFGGGMIGQWCREFSDAHVGCKAKKEAEAERLKGGGG